MGWGGWKIEVGGVWLGVGVGDGGGVYFGGGWSGVGWGGWGKIGGVSEVGVAGSWGVVVRVRLVIGVG